MTMTSSRPYLIRALYEWIVDNNLTPHIVVYAHSGNVSVPQEYVNKDGQIILNIAPRAVSALSLKDDAIAFNARFGGIPTDIYVPSYAVLGIYAKENGQGMMFERESEPEPPTPVKKEKEEVTKLRPSLRVVK
jgi:stringent starvation protein B